MNAPAAAKKTRWSRSVALALLALALLGCGKKAVEPTPVTRRADLAKKIVDYRLRGVVRRVEPELSHVRIAHETIPGLMDTMEMRFLYKDRDLLRELKPGDEVEGTLRVVRENGAVIEYELKDLEVKKPATGPKLVFDSAKHELRSGEPPKKLEPGAPVPDFTMTTAAGKPLKLSDLRGKMVVMTFVYTRCPLPDFCPLMDRKFAELARQAAAVPSRARDIRLISLSFDPDHDTPEVLRKHAQMRGAEPPLWIYAVASHAELAKIAAPLGLFYAPGDREIAHNLCTAVIDGDGKLARLEVGTERNKWSAGDLLKTVYALLPAQKRAPE
jgi:protein SCO1